MTSLLSKSQLSQTALNWYAARLAIAVEDTRKQGPMSVNDLREAFRDIPGGQDLTMSYANNGNQILHIGDKELEVGPMASNDEIRAALLNPFIRTENTKVTMASPLQGIGQRLGLAKHNAEADAKLISAKVDELEARRQAATPKVMAGLEAQGADLKELETFVADIEQATNG